MKVESDKTPLEPDHKIPPPLLLAVLLMNFESVKVPSAPDHKTAPPLPFEKLKF